MDKALGKISPSRSVRPKAVPPPTLLMELEPGYRVFWRNLSDTFRPAPVLRLYLTSKPAPFWNDVFVTSEVPWWSFLESMMWHALLVAAVWSLSQGWALQKQQYQAARRSPVVYYPASLSFPAVRSSPPRSRTRPATGHKILRVRSGGVPSNRPALMAPPKLDLSQSRMPSLGSASAPLPGMPLAATGASRLAVPAGPSSVIAPPPEISRAGTGRSGLPSLGQAAVVGPAPSIGTVSGRRGLAPSSAGIVPPPPSLQGSVRDFGDINIGHSDVVAPAPRLPMHEQRSIPGFGMANLGGAGTAVVPPPPSVRGSKAGVPGGSGSASAGAWRVQVVPPPPLVAPGNSGGSGRGRSLAGNGSGASGNGAEVVPPPPSVAGTGDSVGGGRGKALGGGGIEVVAPPPSVSGTGDSLRVGGSGRGNALAGVGLQGTGPSSSGSGRGNPGATGGGNGASGSGTEAGASQHGNGAGNGGGNSLSGGGPGGSSSGGVETASADPDGAMPDIPNSRPSSPPPVVRNPSDSTAQDLPVRLIGLALALPSSSYFSNYEVFLAERRLSKDEAQLIKLVYVFLPYQRRLSEYGFNRAKSFKLHVTRDPSCDETLLQMTWPEAEQTNGKPDEATESAAKQAKDRNSKLPCYRTTADEYRKAVARAR